MRAGQLWLLAADGGEPRPLTHHATAAHERRSWSPDGTAVYFVAADPPTADERERDRLRRRCVRVRRGLQAAPPLEDRRRDRRRDAAHHRRLVGARVTRCRATARGSRCSARRRPLAGDAYRGEVVGDGRERRERPRADQQRRSKSRRRALARQLAGAVPRRHERAVRALLPRPTLFVVPAAGGTPRALLPDFPYAVDQATWAPDGKSILAVVKWACTARSSRSTSRRGARGS